MNKVTKWIITILVLLGIGYLLTLQPNGAFLSPTAKLIKYKGEEQTGKSHTLDLEKYRPERPNNF